MVTSLASRPPVRRLGRPTSAVAVLLALLGALALAIAPLLAVTRPVAGEAVSAAVVVAAVCATAAPLLALVALLGRRPAVAGALLAGAGALALGLLVTDLQLWAGPIDANRLELFRPLTAARLGVGPGAAVVVFGHGLAVLAGVLGMVTVARAAHEDGYGRSDLPDHDGAAVGRRIGAPLAGVAVAAALALAAALCARPLNSADPVLLMRPLLDAPAAVAVGSALVAAALLVVVAASLVATSVEVAAAAMLGAATAALSLVGPRFAAGVAADGVSVGPGAVVGVLAGLVLAAVAVAVPVVAAARARRGLARLLACRSRPADAAPRAGASGRKAAAAADAAVRSRVGRWHARTGVVTIAAGLLAVAGSLLPVLTATGWTALPSVPATRVVLVTGAVLVVAGVWLLLSEFAALVRPAVGVLWAAQVAAVSGVFAAVLPVLDVPGVGWGPGATVLTLSALAAVGAGLGAACAGSTERDGIDTSEPAALRPAVLGVGVAGALASVVGLAQPLVDGVGPGPGRGVDLWVRVLLVVVVVVAVAVAARSRPARGASLLAGAALAMGTYLIGWPLATGRVAEPVAGPGAVGAILGVVLLGAAAVVAVRSRLR
ncbi:hypothetical protein [Rhodococcus kronopolitis]|uniref:ABC-2 type transport system permease protein n=1 Tax=Rhodococcus kronopolitis TaxID=1460226 RepID=A0ABV9FQS5_9NOCA